MFNLRNCDDSISSPFRQLVEKEVPPRQPLLWESSPPIGGGVREDYGSGLFFCQLFNS